MIELREYQKLAVDKIRAKMTEGHRRIIYHAPCGSGKTATSSDIIAKAYANGKKVLFLAGRRELIFQAKKTLEQFGINCGVIMAGEEPNLDAQVQIASMQTYVRRMNLEELQFNHWWHDADIIFCDEAHGSISPSFQKILQAYGDKMYVIGLSATPCRGDGRGLGEYFDEIVSTVDVGELIEQNYLVPVRYFAPSCPDLTGIKTVAGDYDKKELGERVNTIKLVGDIYDNWSIICPDRPTIIFATNVKHSISIKDAFSLRGIGIEHIDAKTPKEERGDALERLRSGKLQVITNVGILTEGFDFPEASCVILARPTKSLGLFLQMAGRGLRIAQGKNDLVLLDHAGCIENHGRLEWSREWSLDGKKKAWSERKKKDPKEPTMLKCSVCHAVFQGEKLCPDCGTLLQTFGKKIETEDGELKELGKKEGFSPLEKRRWYGMLKHYAITKGYKEGWISHKYKEKTGVWPRGMDDVIPILPDHSCTNWITYQNIKHAKSQPKRDYGPRNEIERLARMLPGME